LQAAACTVDITPEITPTTKPLESEVGSTLKLWCKLAAQGTLGFERATQFVRDWTRFSAAR